MDSTRASRGIQAVLPWAALAAVSVFAVVQMKQRSAAEDRCAALLRVRGTPAGPASTGVDPSASWIADVKEATTPKAIAALRARAAKAKPEEVASLRRALRADAELAPAFARVASAFPDSEESGPFLADLLTAKDAERDPAARVAALGPTRIYRVEVLAPVLTMGSPAVVEEVFRQVGARVEPWSEDELRELAGPIRSLLHSSEPAKRVVGCRAVVGLRAPGLAKDLVPLLRSVDSPSRAAAAHALSRVPDRESARAAVLVEMPRLQADESQEVRTAAAMLAASMGAK